MENNLNATTAITEREQGTILKFYKTREQALHAVDKFDRANVVSAFAVAWAWKQLKDNFQTEDCTLKDMCAERGLAPSSVSERIKVVNKIPPILWGVYNMSQLVEITRLKGVEDWNTYPIEETFPNTLSTREIRSLVKKMDESVNATETGADESVNATETGADETDENINTQRIDEFHMTNVNIVEYLQTVLANYSNETAIAISIRIEVENNEKESFRDSVAGCYL